MKSSMMRAKTDNAKTATKLLVAPTGKASPAKAAEGDEPEFADIASLPQRGAAERIDFLEALPASVEPAIREIARRAAELRARHATRLRLPDALVVSTAVVLGARRVVTTDARWPHLGMNVEVIGEA